MFDLVSYAEGKGFKKGYHAGIKDMLELLSSAQEKNIDVDYTLLKNDETYRKKLYEQINSESNAETWILIFYAQPGGAF